MKLVIGIYGKSCVGKTSVAKVLSRRLGVSVRHCGELVKERAKKLGIDFQNLPDQEHERLDKETRTIAEDCKGILIIEGRYLDRVLKDLPNSLLFHLECSDKERQRRLEKRKKIGSRRAPHKIKNTASRKVLPEIKKITQDCVTIKTDFMSVTQVAKQIRKNLEHSLHDTA